MERSKVTCPIQVCWRTLGPHQEGLLWPSHEVSLDSLLLGSYFSSSSLMLLSYTNSPSPSRSTSYHGGLREFGFLLQPPPSLFFVRAVWVASWRYYSLFSSSISSTCCSFLPGYLGGYCMHWSTFSRCLLTGCHWLRLWLPTSLTTFLRWSGWASLLAGEDHLRGLWVMARCMLSSLVSLGFTKSWVGQVALRSPINQHALDLVVSLDDQGH